MMTSHFRTMRARRKDSLKILAVSVPMLAYGAFTFEIGGAASTAEAIAKSTVTTLGIAGTVTGLLMFFTKNSLGLVNPKEPKPKNKEKKMAKRKLGTSVESATGRLVMKKSGKKSGSESIGLMQREKELVKEEEELNASIKAIKDELDQVRANLETKGWLNTKKGWVIE